MSSVVSFVDGELRIWDLLKTNSSARRGSHCVLFVGEECSSLCFFNIILLFCRGLLTLYVSWPIDILLCREGVSDYSTKYRLRVEFGGAELDLALCCGES